MRTLIVNVLDNYKGKSLETNAEVKMSIRAILNESVDI